MGSNIHFKCFDTFLKVFKKILKTDTQDRPIKVTTRDLQFFGYIHIDRKLLFSMLPSILTFNFCLILGSFFGIWGPNGLILGLMKSSKTFFGSICIAEQLLFSILP